MQRFSACPGIAFWEICFTLQTRSELKNAAAAFTIQNAKVHCGKTEMVCDKRKHMQEIRKIRCNKCGREIEMEHGMAREGVLQVKWDWGYFSEKDGESHSFCLCETCYDEIRKDFVIPVTVEEYL